MSLSETLAGRKACDVIDPEDPRVVQLYLASRARGRRLVERAKTKINTMIASSRNELA